MTQVQLFKLEDDMSDVEVSFVDSDSKTIVQRVAEGQIEVTPSSDIRIVNDNKKNCFKES